MGDFLGTMPSQRRLWETKWSPKERRQEDTGAVLGAKSYEKCSLFQCVAVVKIELSFTRELDFRGRSIDFEVVVAGFGDNWKGLVKQCVFGGR